MRQLLVFLLMCAIATIGISADECKDYGVYIVNGRSRPCTIRKWSGHGHSLEETSYRPIVQDHFFLKRLGSPRSKQTSQKANPIANIDTTRSEEPANPESFNLKEFTITSFKFDWDKVFNKMTSQVRLTIELGALSDFAFLTPIVTCNIQNQSNLPITISFKGVFIENGERVISTAYQDIPTLESGLKYGVVLKSDAGYQTYYSPKEDRALLSVLNKKKVTVRLYYSNGLKEDVLIGEFPIKKLSDVGQ